MSQEAIARKFKTLKQDMDERLQRLWVASEAEALGWGGVSLVAKATGMSRTTIAAGQSELAERRGSIPVVAPGPRRVRRAGGGRKPLTTSDPGLSAALDALVEPTSRGDPMTPLRWTCLSVRTLAQELAKQGRKLSPQKVADLLHIMGYSLRSNRKEVEGTSHPGRHAQFLHISRTARAFQQRGQPVISVKTMEEELPGNVNDTSEFAVASIQRWWTEMGKLQYPDATELLVTAGGGGGSGSQFRIWKAALQGLADATGLKITATHFPPGTSKWNRIEHSLSCHVSQNWQGRPQVRREVEVCLIAATPGLQAADEDPAGVNLETAALQGEWNCTITPGPRDST